MSRIIVTGGDGFIGSNLVDELIKQGHDVFIIDTLVAHGGKNLNPQATFIQKSITDADLSPLFAGAEYIFHLAALPRIQPSIQNPREFHIVNVLGTLNVLIGARDARVKRVIYSASSSAYGDQDTLPLAEAMIPGPKNPYAVQKYMGELYCKLFSDLYHLETVCLRYFNVYGPRQPHEGTYATVIGIFLRQFREKQPLTIIPDGLQTRDFTHVSDIVSANLKAMVSPIVGKGEVINIGSGKNYSVLEVADLIGGEKIFAEPRLGEIRDTLADITLAKTLLDWNSRMSLEEGIRQLKKAIL